MREQTIAMKNTLEEAKAQTTATIAGSRLDHRPWVGPIAPVEIQPIVPGTPARFTLFFTNFGNTPANVVIQANSHIQDGNAPFKPAYYNEVVGPGSHPRLFPSDKGAIEVVTNTAGKNTVVTDRVIESIKNQNSMLYVYGVIGYRDNFSQTHFTRFCFYLANDLMGVNSCKTYNDGD